MPANIKTWDEAAAEAEKIGKSAQELVDSGAMARAAFAERVANLARALGYKVTSK